MVLDNLDEKLVPTSSPSVSPSDDVMLTMGDMVITGYKFLPDDCAVTNALRYTSVSHTALQTYRSQLSTGQTRPLCTRRLGQLDWILRSYWGKLRNMDRPKLLSLVGLVVQSSVLALTTRYSKIQGQRYLASTAVVTSEFFKVILCVCLLAVTAKKTFMYQLKSITNSRDIIKSSVPAILYTLQNNLQFVAMTYLDAATFQITYQLKILTTAMFSVCVLRRRFDVIHWSALVLLAVGVAMVQIPNSVTCSSSGTCETKEHGHEVTVGLVSVLVMCVSSGFAGVYTEKLLKATTSSETVWAKNLQLAITSFFIGLMYVYATDSEAVSTNGFFQNYDLITWAIVLQLAVLGLITSLVMKHADNLIKGFASSIAIIITTAISSLILHDLHLSCSFLLGTVVVLGSILLYNVDRNGETGKPETVV